jgi:hypothetical protein
MMIGYVGGNFTEHVITNEINNYVGSLRITVDSSTWVGTALTNVPIQVVSSIGPNQNFVIQNVYLILPSTGVTAQTTGQLWIQIVSTGGQGLWQSWRSMGATSHSYNGGGVPLGTTTSTSMPPTGYSITATYPINYAQGSGGSTSFLGQSVGIGTARPGVQLQSTGQTILNSGNAGALIVGNANVFYTAATGLWNSTANAGLLISWNYTSGQGRSSYLNNGQGGGGGHEFYTTNTNSAGPNLATVYAGAYSPASDYRIKENVVDISNTEFNDIIDSFRPVYYYNNQTHKNDFGFIAHEVQAFLPDIVDGEKDAMDLKDPTRKKIQFLNYTAIIPHCVHEIKKLRAKNAELESKLAAMEARLSAAGF